MYVLASVMIILLLLLAYFYPSQNPFLNKRVIVVGNSRELLSREMGQEIDDFDVVVRLNNFKIKGYEKYTGTRTDAFHMNHNTIPREEIQEVLDTNDVVWMGTRNKRKFCGRTGVSMFDKRVYQYKKGEYVCRAPTSGTMALSAILNMCNLPVTIVGLGGYAEPGYYYRESQETIDKNWKIANTRHCPEKEQAFLEDAIRRGVVKKLTDS